MIKRINPIISSLRTKLCGRKPHAWAPLPTLRNLDEQIAHVNQV